MRQLWRHTAVIVASIHLLGGALLGVAHRDADEVSPGNELILVRHDCGSTEIHIPLDQMHPCAACVNTTQRTTPPVAAHGIANISAGYLGHIPVVAGHPLESYFTPSGTRGPPPA